jgi:hypothetical protein
VGDHCDGNFGSIEDLVTRRRIEACKIEFKLFFESLIRLLFSETHRKLSHYSENSSEEGPFEEGVKNVINKKPLAKGAFRAKTPDWSSLQTLVFH